MGNSVHNPFTGGGRNLQWLKEHPINLDYSSNCNDSWLVLKLSESKRLHQYTNNGTKKHFEY